MSQSGNMIVQSGSKKLAITIFLIGIIGVIFPYFVNGDIPGDGADARFNIYILEHFYLALTGQVDSFIDASFFYPLTKTALFSDNHWGTGLIYSYFRFFDAQPFEAFISWFLVGFILNYWSSFYVLRKMELSELAAAIGAFLFTFGLPVIAQDGHAQLNYRPFIPLAFLAFHYYSQSKNFYYFAVTFLMVSAQFLISFYMGMFLVYMLIALTAVELMMIPRDKIRNFSPKEFCLTKSVPILVVAISTFVLFALPYLQVKNIYNFSRSFLETDGMLPGIQSYFLSDRSVLWSSDSRVFSLLTARWEHQLFIGIGAFFALLFLYLRKGLIEKNSLSQKYGYALGIMMIATLSIGGFTLYRLLVFIPGSTDLRAVSREILVMIFPIAYLVAFSIDKIRNIKFVTISSTSLVSIICFLIIIDPILADKSISPSKKWEDNISKLQSRITHEIDESNILILRGEDFNDEIDAMLLAQKLGIKTLNGYSGNNPTDGKTKSYTIKDCATARERIRMIKYMMDSSNQNFDFDSSKVIAIGFDKGCNFANL